MNIMHSNNVYNESAHTKNAKVVEIINIFNIIGMLHRRWKVSLIW